MTNGVSVVFLLKNEKIKYLQKKLLQNVNNFPEFFDIPLLQGFYEHQLRITTIERTSTQF